MRTGSTLYLQVYNHVKESILAGHFRPGDMIPTEQELMEKFNVSRITTSRALQMLTTEGLVKRRPGVGTFVSDAPLTQIQASPQITTETEASTQTDSTVQGVGTPLVGFVIPFLDGSFGPTIIKHVERILNERGMSVALAATYGDQKKEAESIDRLVRCGVKGMIVLPVNGEYYSEAILRLHVQRFPIVLVDKSLPGLPISYVTSDNYGATKMLTDHLVSLGHKNIAFFSPSAHGTSTLVNRFHGYVDSLKAHGIRPSAEYHLTTVMSGTVVKGLDTVQVNTITQFLVNHPEVTALVATDDHLAEHVLAAAAHAGRKVPEQLSIACFDGPLVKDVFWNFTHVIQDEAEMARQCLRILDEFWSGKQLDGPEEVILPCQLHIGQSTTSIPASVNDLAL